MSDKVWKVSAAGQTTGPFSDDEVKAQLESGAIPAHAFLWQKGWPDWRPINTYFVVPENAVPPPAPSNYVPQSQPPAKTKPSIGKLAGCGCGTLLVLGIVGAALDNDSPKQTPVTVPASTSSSSSSDERQTPGISEAPPSQAAPTQSEQVQASAETIALGAPFQLGDFKYTISAANTAQVLGNQFINEKAAQGATFVVVTYTIENLGNETATALASDFYLTDAQGRKFTTSSRGETALAMSDQNHDFILSQLQPGVPKQTKQVFEVPVAATQAKGLKLVIPEKGLWGSKSATIPLN